MPEALKEIYNSHFINQLSRSLKQQYSPFNSSKFKTAVFNQQWSQMELKQRMRHITQCCRDYLPEKYQDAVNVLISSSIQFNGFEAMFFPDFVELYGLDDYEFSVSALEHFTKYSSSEFAVRPFIKKYPDKMMHQMLIWAESDNYHVRRLASEGCRPRLPWAMALPAFKQDPGSVLKVIETLMNDESEYVRRSVANNLNDISKDNPACVVDIAQRWLGQTKETNWIIKHACRSMLKAGHKEVLEIFGFSHPKHIQVQKLNLNTKVKWGGELNFSFLLNSKRGSLKKCRIEFALYFMKANKKQSRKVFKVAEGDYLETEKEVSRCFSFKAISTRKYYPGKHALAIIVNGIELEKKDFILRGSNKIR